MISETEIAKFSYEEAPKRVTDKLPGPKTQKILDEAQEYETPTRMSVLFGPLVLDEGRGATVKDPDGNIYIDAIAGVAVASVGRVNPKVVEAIREQSAKLMHTGSVFNTRGVELAKRMSEIMPEGLRGHCFTNFAQSGSAAVETAIKYARAITGRSQIIAFEGAYHGVWCGSLALTSRHRFRHGWGPLIPEVHHMPYGYCYRCFAGLEYPSCELACAKYLDYKLNTSGTGTGDVAAVFVEPIQAEGGYTPPPPEFLGMVKVACEKAGALLVCDEIQCGAGRSGKLWASEHYGVVPDILIFGKGIGSDMPIAGVVVHEKYRDKLPMASQPNTFEQNAVVSAAVLANIDILTDKDMDLVGRAAQVGEEMMNRLAEAAKDIPIIGDVRGKGFMIGIELVEDKESRKPFGNIPSVLGKGLERGVILVPCGRDDNVLRFMPSLVISRAHFNKVVDIVLDILAEEAKSVK